MGFFVGERSAGKNIIEIGVRGWAEFREKVITDLFPSGSFRKGKFLFRGQGSSGWDLSTTFDRWYHGKWQDKNSVADSLLEEFIHECELEDMPETLRSNKMAMLGLGQHHGLPTQLLDWSESPYVAAFFAFSGHVRLSNSINLEKYVAVWVLDPSSAAWTQQYGCTIENVPAVWNPRIKNQFGKFTYLRTPSKTLEEHVAQFEEGDVTLRKYLIPVNQFRNAMADLDAMGLTHARIYPGLEGNARAAEVRIALSRLA